MDESTLCFKYIRLPSAAVLIQGVTMKPILQLWECRRLLGRGRAIWLAAIAVTACLYASPAHAQRHPPTIPNTTAPVTVRSTVGGPNAITFTFGGTQPGQPAPMTFGPAISPPQSSTLPISGGATYVPPTQPMTFAPALPPPPQQTARVFYVYYRNASQLSWICFGGYRTESQAQQSVNWFRQSGGEAFYR